MCSDVLTQMEELAEGDWLLITLAQFEHDQVIFCARDPIVMMPITYDQSCKNFPLTS